MPKRINPQDQWETDFQVPLPGEPRNIGPLETLFQRLLNRTERLKSRLGAILGLPWDATPPDTLAGLAGRVSSLETSQGGTTLAAHRSASVLDHPDGSVTAEKLAPVRNAPTITPSPGDWLLGGLASGTGVGKLPIGQANGVPILNAIGALASADAYLNRGSLQSAIDWNTLTTAGSYAVYPGAFGTGSANTPPASYQYGTLLVFSSGPGSVIVIQVYIPHINDGGMYYRQLYGAWGPWYAAGATYGSNSNGLYTRLADGTQMCWASHTDASFGSVMTGDDANYRYRTKIWTFPAAFISAPVVLTSGDVFGARIDILTAYAVTPTQCALEIGQYNTSAVSVSGAYSLAIGRWK